MSKSTLRPTCAGSWRPAPVRTARRTRNRLCADAPPCACSRFALRYAVRGTRAAGGGDSDASGVESVSRTCTIKRRANTPKSVRPQISHHPDGPCNEESQAEFGPVQMGFWVSDQARNPNQQTKECQHEGHQANRKPCLAIDENGNRRECKCDRRECRPKSPIWRNPLWNQAGCRRKI